MLETLESLHLLFGDCDCLDRIAWKVRVLIRVAARDAVDHIHTFDHLTKNSMQTVQMWRRIVGNKELAAICIRARICHGEQAGSIESQARVNLILELVT